ncbi:hypothetical protein ZWY2020_028495 [Hordeum vulgare]|nr:hypothetical protein ZWY2020_028495 [Hordeum vulgare]
MELSRHQGSALLLRSGREPTPVLWHPGRLDLTLSCCQLGSTDVCLCRAAKPPHRSSTISPDPPQAAVVASSLPRPPAGASTASSR